MKKMMFLSVLLAAMFLSPMAFAQDEFVTSDVLEISDVENFVRGFIETGPKVQFSRIMGIYQTETDPKRAKIFYEFKKFGRSGNQKISHSECNCFKLNDGRWYCGKGYDHIKK